MLLIIGLLVVFVSVFGGYMMEGGALGVLIIIPEYIIIGGAAGGAFLAGTPPEIQKALLRDLPKLMGKNPYGREAFDELFQALFALFNKMRREGLLSIEGDLGEPENSELFKAYPGLLHNHHAMAFLTDSIKLSVSYGGEIAQVEAAMDINLEAHHEESAMQVGALTKIADALPGLGIVAAVLGIIIALGALDAPVAVLGHKIAAALVGTFLGLLLSYGLLQPIAAALESRKKDEERYLNVIREAVLISLSGSPPSLALEIARNAVFSHSRPTAAQLESIIEGTASTPQGAAAK